MNILYKFTGIVSKRTSEEMMHKEAEYLIRLTLSRKTSAEKDLLITNLEYNEISDENFKVTANYHLQNKESRSV